MPPRYAYWTIIVDDTPTAFRAGALEEIMPTFNRLKEKQPTAKLMWFQNGQLWPSRLDAREARQQRGEQSGSRDPRQGGGFRDRDSRGASSFASRPEGSDSAAGGERPEWKPKSTSSRPSSHQAFKPGTHGAKAEDSAARGERPEWKPKSSSSASGWKPASKPWAKAEGSAARGERPEWKPKSTSSRPSSHQAFKPGARGVKAEGSATRGERPEWKPKGESPAPPRPQGAKDWVTGAAAAPKRKPSSPKKGDKNWRPGGEHKDPRQKFKDAKKAKWTRFKKAIRTRHDKKSGGGNDK